MNIISYIDKYGHLTFKDLPFNEVDNIIFSTLTYIDLDKYVSHNNKDKKTIYEVTEEYYKEHNKKEKNILATKNSLKVLRYIKETKRYKDLLLYNYSYIGNHEQQFSALTIEIDSHTLYVAFEGTDQLISGWKEDFMMSYTFPVPSHKLAIEYINKNFTFNTKKIIIGGHSKGGNLALIGAMYSNFLVRRRIVKIYNNDGPGLINKQYESKNYSRIRNKLIHIVPNYSVFGLLLRHDSNYIVIKSTKKSIYAHDFMTWVTEETHFKKSGLSTFSKIIENSTTKWLNTYNYEERELFIEALFKIFDDLNITSLLDIKANKKLILNIITKTKNIDSKTKEMLLHFSNLIIKYFKDASIEELQSLIGNKK